MTQDPAPGAGSSRTPSDPPAPRSAPAPGVPGAPVRRQVRRSPRTTVFLGTGAVIGVLLAAVLTLTSARPDGRDGVDYGLGAVFGYLSVGLGIAGLLAGGAAALLLGRLVRRRPQP